MNTPNEDAPADRGGGTPQSCGQTGQPSLSRQVAWFEVYSFAERWCSRHGLDLHGHHTLIPGTPQWCGLPDDDARKLLSLILGGIREALNHEVAQEHRAAASRALASSTDWTALAQRIRTGRGPAHIERRAAS